jgi:type I restriction enzyme S subunit
MAAYPTVPLREVCESIEYGYTASSTSEPVGPRFLRITDIAQERLDWESVPFCEIEPKKLAKHRLRTGDIVIARTGATTGWAKFIKDPPDAVFASYLVRVQPAASVDARFVGFVVESQVYKDFIQQHMGGAAQPNANAQVLTSYEIPCPPLPVQRRIAGILSAYDELMENSQRRIRLLEAMARALYREWFVHFRFPGHEKHPRIVSPLGDIPQGWEVKKLGDLTAYLNRGLSPAYGDNGDSMVINQKCIRDQRLNLEPARRQTKPVTPDKRVRFGDVLINSTGVGTLGRVAQVYQDLGECTVDTHVTIARPNPETDLDFFGCTLLSHQETFDRLGIGATGQTELSRTSIANVDLVVPPTRIQRRFGEFVRPMRAAAMTHANQIQNLRRTRDLLLPRLLSGKVEPKTQAA